MTQDAPIRQVQVLHDMRAYISDVGAVVIEQECGDTQAVFFDAASIDAVINALNVLRESAIARQSMAEAIVEAHCAVFEGRGPHEL